MIEAGRGPSIACLPYRRAGDMDVSFRVLSAYDPSTDGIVTRFDVMVNSEFPEPGKPLLRSGEQFNVAVHSSRPGCGALLLPEKGTLGSFGLMANAADLITVLRGLADAIEENSLSYKRSNS